MRLQKYLSEQNILSRRQAEKAIANGLVRVNGEVAQIGQQIDPETDDVVVDKLATPDKTLLLVYKPRGVVTNCPQAGEKEVVDILPVPYKHLHSIGRLDKDSEGLILFTDDGVLAKQLLTAKHERVYEVWTHAPLADEQILQLERGVHILGVKTKPATITRLTPANKSLWVLHEGKNRQIRRMVQTCGTHVIRLRRIQYGAYKLGRLKPGQYLQNPQNLRS